MIPNRIPTRNAEQQPPKILTKAPPRCRLCGIELTSVSAHLNKDHCIRDLVQRVLFMRQITAAQARNISDLADSLTATHKVAYGILKHFTNGRLAKIKGKTLRVVLDRADVDTLPEGAAITLSENGDGDYEVVGLVPAPEKAKKPEVKPS